MHEMLKRLLLVELRREGFSQARYDAEKDAVLPSPDFPKIAMRENDILMPREKVQYVLNQKYKSQEELEAPARKLDYDTLLPLHNKVTEMVAAWEKAQPMPIKDVAAFRLLSEYNNVVLAARDDGTHGLHFTTWEYSYDRKGVGHGHYTSDYEWAKKDFATRSGLIQEKLLFQPEQLKQIYSALLFQGRNDDELTYTMEKELHAVIEKLESICPALKELQQQEREQENVQGHDLEPELE